MSPDWTFAPLAPRSYRVIYVDPPWAFFCRPEP